MSTHLKTAQASQAKAEKSAKPPSSRARPLSKQGKPASVRATRSTAVPMAFDPDADIPKPSSRRPKKVVEKFDRDGEEEEEEEDEEEDEDEEEEEESAAHGDTANAGLCEEDEGAAANAEESAVVDAEAVGFGGENDGHAAADAEEVPVAAGETIGLSGGKERIAYSENEKDQDVFGADTEESPFLDDATPKAKQTVYSVPVVTPLRGDMNTAQQTPSISARRRPTPYVRPAVPLTPAQKDAAQDADFKQRAARMASADRDAKALARATPVDETPSRRSGRLQSMNLPVSSVGADESALLQDAPPFLARHHEKKRDQLRIAVALITDASPSVINGASIKTLERFLEANTPDLFTNDNDLLESPTRLADEPVPLDESAAALDDPVAALEESAALEEEVASPADDLDDSRPSSPVRLTAAQKAKGRAVNAAVETDPSGWSGYEEDNLVADIDQELLRDIVRHELKPGPVPKAVVAEVKAIVEAFHANLELLANKHQKSLTAVMAISGEILKPTRGQTNCWNKYQEWYKWFPDTPKMPEYPEGCSDERKAELAQDWNDHVRSAYHAFLTAGLTPETIDLRSARLELMAEKIEWLDALRAEQWEAEKDLGNVEHQIKSVTARFQALARDVYKTTGIDVGGYAIFPHHSLMWGDTPNFKRYFEDFQSPMQQSLYDVATVFNGYDMERRGQVPTKTKVYTIIPHSKSTECNRDFLRRMYNDAVRGDIILGLHHRGLVQTVEERRDFRVLYGARFLNFLFTHKMTLKGWNRDTISPAGRFVLTLINVGGLTGLVQTRINLERGEVIPNGTPVLQVVDWTDKQQLLPLSEQWQIPLIQAGNNDNMSLVADSERYRLEVIAAGVDFDELIRDKTLEPESGGESDDEEAAAAAKEKRRKAKKAAKRAAESAVEVAGPSGSNSLGGPPAVRHVIRGSTSKRKRSEDGDEEEVVVKEAGGKARKKQKAAEEDDDELVEVEKSKKKKAGPSKKGKAALLKKAKAAGKSRGTK